MDNGTGNFKPGAASENSNGEPLSKVPRIESKCKSFIHEILALWEGNEWEST